MALDSYLVLRHRVADILAARILVREGLVKINGQTIRRWDVPVSTKDKITITNARLASMPSGYFMIRELQRIRNFFTSTTDALCIGTHNGVFVFLKEIKATAVNAGNAESGVRQVPTILINVFTEKVSSRHNGKFNYILVGRKFGLFATLGILERNIDVLLPFGRALVETVNEKITSSKAIHTLVKRAGFEVEERLQFDIEPSSGWLILKPKRRVTV